MDAGAEAGDRGGEPRAGTERDRGGPQIRDQDGTTVQLAPAIAGWRECGGHTRGAAVCRGGADARAISPGTCQPGTWAGDGRGAIAPGAEGLIEIVLPGGAL